MVLHLALQASIFSQTPCLGCVDHSSRFHLRAVSIYIYEAKSTITSLLEHIINPLVITTGKTTISHPLTLNNRASYWILCSSSYWVPCHTHRTWSILCAIANDFGQNKNQTHRNSWWVRHHLINRREKEKDWMNERGDGHSPCPGTWALQSGRQFFDTEHSYSYLTFLHFRPWTDRYQSKIYNWQGRWREKPVVTARNEGLHTFATTAGRQGAVSNCKVQSATLTCCAFVGIFTLCCFILCFDRDNYLPRTCRQPIVPIMSRVHTLCHRQFSKHSHTYTVTNHTYSHSSVRHLIKPLDASNYFDKSFSLSLSLSLSIYLRVIVQNNLSLYNLSNSIYFLLRFFLYLSLFLKKKKKILHIYKSI